jgi:hypothetical protein
MSVIVQPSKVDEFGAHFSSLPIDRLEVLVASLVDYI